MNISVQNVRTSLEHLKITNEVTHQAVGCCSIITVKNYKKYQSGNTQTNKELTNYQQTANKQLTTTKERNKEKKKESNYMDNLFKKLEELARLEDSLSN